MHSLSLQGASVTLDDLMQLRLAVPPKARENARVTLPASGARLSRFRGRGIEFTEVRAYQPGDDLRAIDWKVTARRMTAHTRIYQEERERPELLLVDQTPGMFFGTGTRLKSVHAAESAARLAWQCFHRGDRVGGMVLGSRDQVLIKPRRRLATVLRLLRAIAHANQALLTAPVAASMSLAEMLLRAKRLAPGGHGIHVLSDFGEPLEELKPHLARLACKNEVQLIFIYDRFEAEPPGGRFPLFKGTERLVFNTSDASTRTAFRHAFESRVQALREVCQSTGCRLLECCNQQQTGRASHGGARAA